MTLAADYDRFSVVAFASEPVRARIGALRQLLPPSGRPILAPHVTLKAPFVNPVDLDGIAARVRACCAEGRPIAVRPGALYHYEYAEFASVGIAVESGPELRDLHRRLVEALGDLHPLGEPAEDPERYHPHLTIVQQIPLSAVPIVLAEITAFGAIEAFELHEAAVVGRRVGGQWETLATARFAG